jgi:hypothetical protein
MDACLVETREPFERVISSLSVARPFPKIEKILGELGARRRPSLQNAIQQLQTIRGVTGSGRILAELAPNTFQAACADGLWRMLEISESFRYGDATPDIVSSTLNAIQEIAPLDWDAMENQFSNEDEVIFLIPDCYGYPMGWDDWDQIREDLESTSLDLGMYIFFTTLRLGDMEIFEAANEQFEWGIERIPERLADRDMGTLDRAKLFRSLDRAKMGCFKDALEVCFYDTGNVYFDYNPYDEGEVPSLLPPYAIEGVRDLAAQWKAAQPILANLRIAQNRFMSDPGVPDRLYKAYLRYLDRGVPRERIRVRTLGDIFAEEPRTTRGDDFAIHAAVWDIELADEED